jgi:hypothetical protein
LTIRTEDELYALKRSWREDPCWDIENIEGYEAHHDELLAWRESFEAAQEAREVDELLDLAKKEGLSNIADARDIRNSERRESRAMEDAIAALRHMYRNAGGPDYADFSNVAHHIAEVAEARVTRTLIRELSKREKS